MHVPRITEAWAQQLFAQYNEKFWRGTLPRYWIILMRPDALVGKPATGEHTGLCDTETRTIYLHPELSRRRARQVLIHEMAHAATIDTCWLLPHSRPWIEEMVRLEREHPCREAKR